MNEQEIYDALSRNYSDAIAEFVADGKMPFAIVRSNRLKDVMHELRSHPELAFDFLSSISGVDHKERIEVVYHLFSLIKKHRFTVKVCLDRENPEIDTVTDIWPGANWHEREAFDLVGVRFKGHPDLRRILLAEDWQGHPLLKDYTFPDEYHGISNW